MKLVYNIHILILVNVLSFSFCLGQTKKSLVNSHWKINELYAAKQPIKDSVLTSISYEFLENGILMMHGYKQAKAELKWKFIDNLLDIYFEDTLLLSGKIIYWDEINLIFLASTNGNTDIESDLILEYRMIPFYENRNK